MPRAPSPGRAAALLLAACALAFAAACASARPRADDVATPASPPEPGAATAIPGAATTARVPSASRPRSGGAPGAKPPAAAKRDPKPFCAGEYADDLSALSAAAREFDRQVKRFTFCIRTTATYECPYYSSDGTLRRVKKRVTAHGTAFGYRRDGNEALVVTNQHVAEWPAVTDPEHAVEGVPTGCRRVADAVRIVDDESDAYDRDDMPLSHVVSDPQLDIALLRAKAPLPVMPWKVGRSAALRERNAVDVRGFPLGVLRTTTVGKVTSAYEHDGERDWDHDDFVIDALLSPGNSGSPVFAVSCRTGEFELVGVYHAGYVRGSALNVVIGIDQVRELLETQRRRPARPKAEPVALDAAARGRVLEWARSGPGAAFPFGATVASATARGDGAVVFALGGRDFPVRSVPVLVLEDLPAEGDAFGRPGRVWAGNGSGLREVERGSLEADAQAQLARLLDALRRDATLAASFRAAARVQASSREKWEAISRLERSVRRLADARQDTAQNALDLADRLAAGEGDLSLVFADLLAAPPSAPGPARPAARPGEDGPPASAAAAAASAAPAASAASASPEAPAPAR